MLPSVPLPSTEVEIGGQKIQVRSLSRKDLVHLASTLKDDPDSQENFSIAVATGVTLEDAAKWRETTGFAEVQKLLDAIVEVSGTGSNLQKG